MKSEVQTNAATTGVDPESWVTEHGDYLFRYAILSLRKRDLAEDLVQDTFVSAIRAIDTFEGRSSVRTWLRGILRHKIIDHHRANKRTKELPFDETETDDTEAFFNRLGIWKQIVRKWDDTPEKVLEQKRFYRALDHCIGNLPDKLGQVFVLRTFENASTEEICKDLDITPSNVWVILHRARARLRNCLDQNWFSQQG